MLVLVGLGLRSLLPSDAALAQRAGAELEAALGVPVSVGTLHWRLRPSVVVVLENVATQQTPPIVIKQLTANLNVPALWQGRLKLERVEVDGAVLPQLSLRGLHAPLLAPANPSNATKPVEFKTGHMQLDDLPLEQLVFRNVSWISRHGGQVVYDGEVQFDSGWRPRKVELQRLDFEPVTRLSLVRQAQSERWDLHSTVGGGSVNGELQLQTHANGELQLDGKLKLSGIEAVSALAAFNLSAIITGPISGDTTVSAQGANLAELVRSLRTSTSFAMGRSALLRFDLRQAIRGVGKTHTGETALDTVSGQLTTHNTADGMVLDFTQVKAASGILKASGKAHIAKQQIQGELTIDLVQGLVGIPLNLSGPLAHIKVSVPHNAVVGAVVGRAVLHGGAGTVMGARIGVALGRMLNDGPPVSFAPSQHHTP
ncbi:hypothetical protein AwPolaro_06430 [Polaromonas sp.]|nr:hypothetical protein AwPolaro_06430 [Polaromonas sp.]